MAPRQCIYLYGLWACCLAAWLLALSYHTLDLTTFPESKLEHREIRSITSAMTLLLSHDQVFVASLLFVFTILLPIFKLCVQCLIVFNMASPHHRRGYLTSKSWLTLKLVLLRSAPFQMLDIFVGLFLVKYFNGHMVKAILDNGFYVYFSYCLLSMGLSQALELCGEAQHSDGLNSPLLVATGEMSVHGPGQLIADGDETSNRNWPSIFIASSYLATGVAMIRGTLFTFRISVAGLLVDSTRASAAAVLRAGSAGISSMPLLAQVVSWIFSAFIWVLTLVLPCCMAAAILVAEVRPSLRGQAEWCVTILQHWSTVDVFALAAAAFLIVAQTDDTSVVVAWDQDSVPAFCLLLASGYLFMTLRCLSITCPDLPRLSASVISQRLSWGAGLCLLLAVAALRADFQAHDLAEAWELRSAATVCQRSKSLVAEVMGHLRPTLGLCDPADYEGAPQPCQETGSPLYHPDPDDVGLRIAVPWLTGVNSLKIDSCHNEFGHMNTCTRQSGRQCRYLPCWVHFGHAKMDCVNGECLCPFGQCLGEQEACFQLPNSMTSNHLASSSSSGAGQVLTLFGHFESLKPYLEVQRCPVAKRDSGLLGWFEKVATLGASSCSRILGSSDLCCGNNIDVRIQVEIPCRRPGEKFPPPARTRIDLLSPLWVDLKIAGRHDIAPAVQSAVNDHLSILDTLQMSWGGKPISFAEFASVLAERNAPPGSLDCPA